MFATNVGARDRGRREALASAALRLPLWRGPCHAAPHDYPLLQSDGAALTQPVYLCTHRAR